jgi:hypothetical protein
MSTRGQRLRRQTWRDVRVNFALPIVGESEREDAVMAVLRRSFREGPAAAANAQAAYKSWGQRMLEVGGSEAMPPAAGRWREFLDRWTEYDPGHGGFAEIDGVDFGPVQRQKPRIRMRM